MAPSCHSPRGWQPPKGLSAEDGGGQSKASAPADEPPQWRTFVTGRRSLVSPDGYAARATQMKINEQRELICTVARSGRRALWVARAA